MDDKINSKERIALRPACEKRGDQIVRRRFMFDVGGAGVHQFARDANVRESEANRSTARAANQSKRDESILERNSKPHEREYSR